MSLERQELGQHEIKIEIFMDLGGVPEASSGGPILTVTSM
jgi:hypothetical protein